MEVRIHENVVTLGKLIGEGGEARVYKLDDSTLAKIYRMPCDPDLGDDQVAAARLRVIVAQRKLPLFPRGLPASIVAPQDLIRETRSNLVVGYTMPFVKGARPLSDFKSASIRNEGVTDQSVIALFKELALAVREVHTRGTIIGDFNDTNVLVARGGPRIIDADSMQYGPFRSKVFMPAFVDPNRCDPNAKTLELAKTHDEESDWYAWTVMLFQSLFFIHPYGGVFRSKDVPAAVRGLPQHRVSVYHPEVKYPAQARNLSDVPAALTTFFKSVFVSGLRPEPTDALFDGLAFKADGSFDKSRSVLAVAKAVKSAKKIEVRKACSLADALAVDFHLGKLTCLTYSQADRTLRRNGNTVTTLKSVGNGLEFFVAGDQTVMCQGNEAIVFSEGWKSGLKLRMKPSAIPAIDNGVKKYSMCSGSEAGTVYWDGQYKLVVGRSEPAIKTLDIDSEALPLRIWANGDLLFVLCSRRGKLGYLLHNMSWDATLYQHAYPVAEPEKVLSTHCRFNVENAWIFLRQADGRATCDVLDEKGKLRTHLDCVSKDWTDGFEQKALWGRMLFSPNAAGVMRATVENGKLVLTEFTYAESQKNGQDYCLIVDSKLHAFDIAKVLELTVV